ncbi:MAG: glycosyltransferase family 4 protein [Vitreimonas sp.]
MLQAVSGKVNRSIALIGSYPPRRCGIATFTCDLYSAFHEAHPQESTFVVAISEPGFDEKYPPEVAFDIRRDALEDYEAAAARLNRTHVGMVCIQHEFGIFGGEAGAHILALIEHLECPVAVTLHTVLAEPSEAQRAVMRRLIESADTLIVMAETARLLLERVYQAPRSRISIIPHGAPDCPLVSTSLAKEKLGYSGRSLLLTFGLLSANKGIETVIRAMPGIVAARPDALYVVLGATHPNVRAREGEVYRERLIALAAELGVGEAVAFENAFVDRKRLLQYLSAADIYVTPYLNPAQITSGTLAYAVALGRPVISTPYWHAQEILADGRGVLVPFNDSNAIADAAAALLLDDAYRERISRSAYASGRRSIWKRVGQKYLDLFAALTGSPDHQNTPTRGASEAPAA